MAQSSKNCVSCQKQMVRKKIFGLRNLLLSRFDYGNALLFGAKKSDLEKLQNWAARLIVKANKDVHASELLHKLHWLPICQKNFF